MSPLRTRASQSAGTGTDGGEGTAACDVSSSPISEAATATAVESTVMVWASPKQGEREREREKGAEQNRTGEAQKNRTEQLSHFTFTESNQLRTPH